MSIMWDRATTQPKLLTALINLNPHNKMQLYGLVSKAWKRITLAFLQRARNVQTIVEALVYNRTRPSKRPDFSRPARPPIPEPCGPTLVQTILHAHLLRPPTAQPHAKPPMSQVSTLIRCEHDRCDMYTNSGMRRGLIIGRVLYCPVCQLFNHAAKHTHYIERALKTIPRLRLQLGQWTFIPDNQTALTTTAVILRALRTHPAKNIRSLLNHLRFQHSHMYTTQRPEIETPIAITHNHLLPMLYTTLHAPLTPPLVTTLFPTRSPTTANCSIAIAVPPPCARAQLFLLLH